MNLDTTQYVKVSTGLTPVTLQSLRDEVRITFSENKPTKGNNVFHTLSGKDAPLQFNSVGTNIWALSITDRSSLVSTETPAATVTLGSEVVDVTLPKLISKVLEDALYKSRENSFELLEEIRLLNARVEATFETHINKEDL